MGKGEERGTTGGAEVSGEQAVSIYLGLIIAILVVAIVAVYLRKEHWKDSCDVTSDMFFQQGNVLRAERDAALEEVEKESGRPLYTVLRFRAENPKHPSLRLAAELSAKLGKPLNAAGVRQTLHRARE